MGANQVPFQYTNRRPVYLECCSLINQSIWMISGSGVPSIVKFLHFLSKLNDVNPTTAWHCEQKYIILEPV